MSVRIKLGTTTFFLVYFLTQTYNIQLSCEILILT